MKKNKKGFTLIELLVVIAIIGLLSTLAIVALNSAREKSRNAKRVSDIKQIQTALELYYNDQFSYPPTADIAEGDPVASDGVTYMSAVPVAPTPADGSCGTDNSYDYTQLDSGASYTLQYCLGSDTGDVTAGTHLASPSGIQ